MTSAHRIAKTVLFSVRLWKLVDNAWVLSETEEVREARVFTEPMVQIRSDFSADTRWEFLSDVLDPSRIVGPDRYYVSVLDTAEFRDLDAVRSFYEVNMRAQITTWVEEEATLARPPKP